MANIKKIVGKKGVSYKITVLAGADSSGKQYREYFTFKPDPQKTEKQNEKALQKVAFEFEEKVKQGKYLDGEQLTFQTFAAKWLEDYAIINLQKSTIVAYTYYLKEHIYPAIGYLKIAKVNPLHINAYYRTLIDKGYANATIKKHHTILSSVFNKAVQWQIVDSNPCSRVTPPKVKETASTLKFFTTEQTQIFLKALDIPYVHSYAAHDRIDDTGKGYHVAKYTETRTIPNQFKLLFNMAIYGGFRRGELIALTWQDIDFKNSSVKITKSTASVKGEVITKEPKTKASIRDVSMPNHVMQLLKQYRADQAQYRLTLGNKWEGGNADFLFIQEFGKQMNVYTPYSKFQDIIDQYNATLSSEVGKLPKIPFHGLRHTSATLLISNNVDVVTVAHRLGHSETSTTLNTYAHSLKSKDKEAANVLGNLFAMNA